MQPKGYVLIEAGNQMPAPDGNTVSGVVAVSALRLRDMGNFAELTLP